jgi:thymidylate synthase (FAD)
LQQITVLDHGFVALRNLAGPTRRPFDTEHGEEPFASDDQAYWRAHTRAFDADDVDPAQAARMSFDQMDSNRTAEQDHKLAAYLMRNWHTSPFEMVECWFEMKLPIFVARQFVRHRTVSINEVSGRYVTLPEEWYVPEAVGGKAPDAKQGQADNLSGETQAWFQEALNLQCAESYSQYLEAIARGVAPEHARLLLHLNHYTHWLWKQDLHNVMHFLRLRDHSHAQVEAQAYARAVDRLLREQLPVSMALYNEHRRMT